MASSKNTSSSSTKNCGEDRPQQRGPAPTALSLGSGLGPHPGRKASGGPLHTQLPPRSKASASILIGRSLAQASSPFLTLCD